MSAIQQILIDHIDVWTAAETEKKSGRGRSSGNGVSVYGIKKLRELILELAVRGKLVPQDPNDEPASELLKRIQVEKAKLVAEGKIKKDKLLPPISDEEKPFELPQGWEWVRLGVLTQKLTDGSHNPPRDAGEGFPMLSSQNVSFGKIDFESPSRYVSAEDFEIENSRTRIESGDVLLTIVASIGRSAVVPDNAPKFVLQRSVAVIKTNLLAEFLCLHLGSPLCLRFYDIHGKGTAQKGIYLGQLSEMPIAVPPLAEQHRIVAKVDELMALCDQLESQHNNATEAHEKLVSHLLGTLTQSQSADDFSANWQRIAVHFDTLFITEASIDALKQTLLQLAVMGKLVPQNPNDEPASELLKRIQAEKAKLVAEGKIKKDKPLPPITDEEKPFELHKSWAWMRLSEIANIISGNAFNSEDFNCEAGAKVIKITNAGVHEFIYSSDYLPESFLSKYMEYLVKEGDLILALTRPYISTGLKISVCPPDYDNALLNQRVAGIRVCSIVNSKYVFQFLKSPYVLELYQDRFSNSGLQPNLKVSDVTELIIAIPPILEQHRIVAKVDELMLLCEQLKSSITVASLLQQKLAHVVVERAIAS